MTILRFPFILEGKECGRCLAAWQRGFKNEQEDEVFFGKVIGIRSLISYEGATARELIKDFHDAVDDYLALCEAEGREPEKAYKGSFNIRISPELHKQAVRCAESNQMSLNSFVEKALRLLVASSL